MTWIEEGGRREVETENIDINSILCNKNYVIIPLSYRTSAIDHRAFIDHVFTFSYHRHIL